jgi:hypothetical protein
MTNPTKNSLHTLLGSYCDALRAMGGVSTADMVTVLSVELTNTLRRDKHLSRQERHEIIDVLAARLKESQ